MASASFQFSFLIEGETASGLRRGRVFADESCAGQETEKGTAEVEGVVASGKAKSALMLLPRTRERHLLVAFLSGLAMALCWRAFAVGSIEQFFGSFLSDRSGIGAAEVLALAVLFYLAMGVSEDEALTKVDCLLLAGSAVFFVVPARIFAAAPLLLVGTKLTFRKVARLSSIGQLLLALAFYEWVSPALFHFVSPFVLRAETAAVQGLLLLQGGFFRDGLIIGHPGGPGLYLEETCSAFHNVSLAALIWLSLLKLDGLTIKGSDVVSLAAMAGVTVALNTLRIALMAQSDDMFAYWHYGLGGDIIAFAMLASTLGVFLGIREVLTPS